MRAPGVAVGGEDRLRAENERLRRELAQQRSRSGEEERQLERYASDLRDIFKAERAHAEELRVSYVATVRALTNAVEARDAYTGKHAERVAAYGLLLTRGIDPTLADDPQTEFGFLLHDVGKVAIPDHVLHKPDHLRSDESELMRRHVVIGWEIVSGVPFLERAAEIVRAHHERWDGTGYPDGLVGEEIPLAARIFSVADTLDALTTDRPYRRGVPMPEAREVIAREAGSQFDPMVVEQLAATPHEVLESIRDQTG
ncbi:MAG: HD domain-containing protein [Actinomycetota bacterium]|nr:HD domain-containing protein [Actinomycetota bacterium]